MTNEEFGNLLAKTFFGTGIKTLPFMLNSEQSDAFRKEWYKLYKESKRKE